MINILLSLLLPCLSSQKLLQAVWYEPNGVTIISADRTEVFDTWPIRLQQLTVNWLSSDGMDLDKDGIVNLNDFNYLSRNYHLSRQGTYVYTVTVIEQ